jgi:hypothetical protein
MWFLHWRVFIALLVAGPPLGAEPIGRLDERDQQSRPNRTDARNQS